MGKGSKRRPTKIPRDKFEDNWERVFGDKKKQPMKKGRQDYIVEEHYYGEIDGTSH